MDQKEVDFTVHFRIGSTQRNYWKSWRRLGRRCRTGCRAKQSDTRPGEPGRTRKRPGEAAAAGTDQCGQPGHFSRECPSAQAGGAGARDGCHKCGKAGHFARECTEISRRR